jgi:hypothetical protein
MPDAPIQLRRCPDCDCLMSLRRVAASPSADYEAHTFECTHCRFAYTARVETAVGISKQPKRATPN